MRRRHGPRLDLIGAPNMIRVLPGFGMALILLVGTLLPVSAQTPTTVKVEAFDADGTVAEVEQWFTSADLRDELHIVAAGATVFATADQATAAYESALARATGRVGEDGMIEWLGVVAAPDLGEERYAFAYIFDLGGGQLVHGTSLVVRTGTVIHNWAGWGSNPTDQFFATARASLPLTRAVDVADDDALLALLPPLDRLPEGFTAAEATLTRLAAPS
jgi:hypothetical protein